MSGFTRLAAMPPADRKARGTYVRMIGADSWDDILDGQAYAIELPSDDSETCFKFIKAARAVVWTKGVRSQRNLMLHVVKDRDAPFRRFTLQMLDKGATSTTS